ncbi:MAG TPA: recombination mediator RecR [Candidatus Peribacteraceae bacterium]|nr:recombination mediator RecR [Candidatus Peribacteraceae bacterium]
MPLLPPQITRAIEEFQKLPGVGHKSAERLVFHLLRSSRADPTQLGRALIDLKQELRYCRECQMITLGELCEICADPARDHATVLVVEEPLEVVAFEKTSYKGVYHVLHGVLSPIDGLGPEQLKVRELIQRAQRGDPSDPATGRAGIKEVIIATDPDVEGEATASYLRTQLEPFVSTITRLAHGLPMGADIEFADQVTLREALAGRRSL